MKHLTFSKNLQPLPKLLLKLLIWMPKFKSKWSCYCSFICYKKIGTFWTWRNCYFSLLPLYPFRYLCQFLSWISAQGPCNVWKYFPQSSQFRLLYFLGYLQFLAVDMALALGREPTGSSGHLGGHRDQEIPSSHQSCCTYTLLIPWRYYWKWGEKKSN